MPSRPTREERVERQQRDPGLPHEIVHYTPTRHTEDSTWPRSGGDHYHDNENCAAIYHRDRVKKTTRQKAQDRWLAPCKRCVPLGEDPKTPPSEKYDDPLLHELSDQPTE